MEVLYEDNHLIVVNKACGEIVQGDQTGDRPLCDKVADYLIEKYHKPGRAFVGVTHRLDRPTSGIVIFAKTGKALARMNALFRDHKIQKIYRAIVDKKPIPSQGSWEDYLYRNAKQNKSYVVSASHKEAQRALLDYCCEASIDRYHLIRIHLHTGRHHQIRAQLAQRGIHIKGDLKYGAARSNPDKGISLHASEVEFIHPVSGETIHIRAPFPRSDAMWQKFS